MEHLMVRAQNIIDKIKVNGSTKVMESQKNDFKCPNNCVNGFIIDKEKNSGRPCNCLELRKYHAIIAQSEISEAFKEYTFDNFEIKGKDSIIKDAKYIAMKYCNEFDEITQKKNHSLVFMGQSGSGKTHLTIAIAHYLMKKHIPVLYMPYVDNMTYLKQVVTNEINYQREISKYKTASVLLIDDLYKGTITASDHKIVFEIINHRYLKKRPVIISTEKSIDDLLDYDEAIGSRIVEMAKKRIVEIRGKHLNHRLI